MTEDCAKKKWEAFIKFLIRTAIFTPAWMFVFFVAVVAYHWYTGMLFIRIKARTAKTQVTNPDDVDVKTAEEGASPVANTLPISYTAKESLPEMLQTAKELSKVHPKRSKKKKMMKDKYGELVEYLRNNMPEGAKKLINENKELMTYEVDGRIPLHWACSGGCLPFVELAVLSDNNLIKKADNSGLTPLMLAVSSGRLNVAKYLLCFTQCDPNHKNNKGRTPLSYACANNNFQMAKLLLENGASVNDQDKNGRTPLHCAAAQGNLKLIRLLTQQKGLRIDMPDRDGNTPLHITAKDNNEAASILLVRAGADINKRNKENKSPLELVKTADLRVKITESSETVQ